MKTLLDNNRSLAIFETDEPEVLKRDLEKAGTVESMQYHQDWNSLMSVITKIESLKFKVSIFNLHPIRQRCIILGPNDIDIIGCSGDDKLETTYRAAVQFVDWFNENY